MHPASIPEKPLTVSANTNIEPAKKIFFFERDNGQVINTEERDAWTILNGRNQVVGRRTNIPKLIGVSDGVAYQTAVKESHEIFKTSGLEAAQAHLRKALTDELEKARGKIEMPRNFDTTDNNGNPVNINLLR